MVSDKTTQSETTDGPRALLTDREREILAGQADVSDGYRRKVEWTARQRVEQTKADVAVLRERHPETFARLRAIVCEDEQDHEEGDR